MIKRIIFLVETTFNKRDYERFGISLLGKNGFKVEVWDATPVFQLDYHKNYAPPDKFKFNGLEVFNNKQELYERLENLRKSDLIILGGLKNYSYFNFHQALSRSEADYAVFMANALPEQGQSTIVRFKSNFKKLLNLKKLFRFLVSKLAPKLTKIKKARFILAGGRKSIKKNYLIGKNTQIIWAHTLDYDLYLKEKSKKAKLRNIAVFLDEYQPFHPNWIPLGVAGKLDPDRYFKLINSFFDLVEKKTGLRVVIAAHPRSKYEEHGDCWKGRKWIRGKSIELVKQAKLIIAHSSTSISFANLFRKPIIFINDAELNKMPVSCYLIKAMSEAHGKKQIFIDNKDEFDKINWEEEMKVDKKTYDKYREDYIKTKNNPDKLFWQIVSERLKQEK